MTPLERLLEAFRVRAESLIDRAPDVFMALVVLVVFVILGRLAGRLLDRVLVRGRLSATHRGFFRGLAAWLVGLLGVALALSVLGLSGLAAGLVTSGGITAIVLGFAFRGIGENLLAGFFLAFSRPFDVGDYIASEGLEGTVRGIALRSTHIRTTDGLDVYIPSAQIFNSPLINFTRDNRRRPSFRIGLDYRSDLPAARELLLDTVRKVSGVLEQPPVGVFVVGTQAQYVELEVAFWIDTAVTSLGPHRGEIIEACVAALAEAGFVLSSEITTGVVLDVPGPVPVAMTRGEARDEAGDEAGDEGANG